MLIEFSKSTFFQKARSQPNRVRQVLEKIRTDGFAPTIEAVFRKLDRPIPLGYCNAGLIIDIGPDVRYLQLGDRVISNGSHAEIVCVPRNLVAKIPDSVSDEAASFTVLGAIALQGLRLAEPTFGERFMVMGMGLIGLLTVQLLRANGCSVLAVDIKKDRLALAGSFGAETVDVSRGGDPIAVAQAWTGGEGVDGVIITASAKTDEIVHQAAEASRKRGRIILVGVVGLNLRRDDFYKKELSFQVSCSYGPGRYDTEYEQMGHDYPLPYVRWTAGRNFEAILGAMASGGLKVEPLITHRYKFEDAHLAYDALQNDPNALGVALEYAGTAEPIRKIGIDKLSGRTELTDRSGPAIVGVIGAGNFAVNSILPAIAKTGAKLKYVAGNRNVVAVTHAGRKFGAEFAVTDYRILLDDPEVNTVFIITGHDTHAQLVCEALKAGKHVFVEKPLCISRQGLDEIRGLYGGVDPAYRPLLMVGFNRRFSPHIVKIREVLAGRSEPLTLVMTVNAGMIPHDHWTQDPERGGGRIIGEACHFIDLLSYIAGSPVAHVSAMMVGEGPSVREDKMSISLGFEDGSLGTVHYFANGSRSYPKEILDVFSDGRVLRMENFRGTKGFGFKGFRRLKTWRQDKGHETEVAEFLSSIANGDKPLIPFSDLVNVTLSSFAAVESARTGHLIKIES